jgi:NTE family protein
MPLSFAVAASSAVPLLLSPMTVRNYAGTCSPARPRGTDSNASHNLSARLLRVIEESYRDTQRPYIHLIDGGLADNLGVRALVDHTIASGSLHETFRHLPPGSVHKIVLVVVNSERDLAERIDDSERVPGTLQVLDATIFGAGSRWTEETTEMVKDYARRAADELRTVRGRKGSPFAPDAEIFVINVRLRDLRDEHQPQDAAPRPERLRDPAVALERAAGSGARACCARHPSSSGCAAACAWPKSARSPTRTSRRQSSRDPCASCRE